MNYLTYDVQSPLWSTAGVHYKSDGVAARLCSVSCVLEGPVYCPAGCPLDLFRPGFPALYKQYIIREQDIPLGTFEVGTSTQG